VHNQSCKLENTEKVLIFYYDVPTFDGIAAERQALLCYRLIPQIAGLPRHPLIILIF